MTGKKDIIAPKAGWTQDLRSFPGDTACPTEHLHTPVPADYVQRAEWSDRMMKTHHQWRCDGCHRWAIWEPKGARGEPLDSSGPAASTTREEQG